MLFAPISRGKSGKFFADCLECRKKIFLSDMWEWDMGFPPEAARAMKAFLPMSHGSAVTGPEKNGATKK